MSEENASPSPTPTGLLFYGILTGDAAQVEAALNLGASASAQEAKHWNILERAIADNNANVFHLFCRPEAAKFSKSSLNAPPRPPLFFAVKHEHYDVALLLLDRGADPNWTAPPVHEATGDSFALLPLAVQGGDLRLVSALLRAGADINQTTIKGMNALRVAVKIGSVPLTRILLSAGSNAAFVAPNGVTLLMEAAGHGSVGFGMDSRLPADNFGMDGARFSFDPENAKTAAEILKELEEPAPPPKEYAEIAGLLLAHGANIHAVVPFGSERNLFVAGTTALQAAVTLNDTAMAQLLLEAGADPNTKGTQFHTPLTSAVGMRTSLEMLHLLHEHGANINQADQSGTTPLMAAATSGRADLVARLLAWGADIQPRRPSSISTETGEDAFLCAVCAGHADCAALLLDAGADSNVRYAEGRDALMLAAYKRRAAVVRLLLDRGADPTRQDDDGKTARDWAETPAELSHVAAKAGEFLDKWGKTPEQIAETMSREIKQEMSGHGPDFTRDIVEKTITEIVPQASARLAGLMEGMQIRKTEKLRREAENQAEILQMLSDAEARAEP